MSPPVVSFIVVNYNGKSCIEECLRSIATQTFTSFEIIVVDNASIDGSKEILSQRPDLHPIFNDTNEGFGKANNQAINTAKGEYFALINNDVVLDSGWLAAMVAAIQKDPRIGMAAGKTLSLSNPRLIDNTGHLLYPDGLNRGRGRSQADTGQFDNLSECFFPSGCAAVYKREMLEQIGLFDEDFFLYGDDAELGLRARLAGWESAFVPQALAYHGYSSSSAPYHPMKFFFVERNRIWVAIKYFPGEVLLLNPFFSLFRYFWHALAMISGRGVTGEFAKSNSILLLFRLLIRAQIEAWKALPQLLKKRRAFFHSFGGARKIFYRCLWRYRIGLHELTFTS